MRAYGTVGTGTGTAGPLDLPLAPTRYRDQLAEPSRRWTSPIPPPATPPRHDNGAPLPTAVEPLRRTASQGAPPTTVTPATPGTTRTQITPAIAADIVDRYLSGQPINDIAADLGISVNSVYRTARNQGLPPRRMPVIDPTELTRRWLTGQTPTEIAAALGASTSGVRHAAQRLGLPAPPRRPRPRSFDPTDVEHRYQTGQPLADIAATLGISITSITACIRRAGLPRRRQANQP